MVDLILNVFCTKTQRHNNARLKTKGDLCGRNFGTSDIFDIMPRLVIPQFRSLEEKKGFKNAKKYILPI